MKERQEHHQENREVRPLARVMARELSQDEIAQISAACGGCVTTGDPLDMNPDAIL